MSRFENPNYFTNEYIRQKLIGQGAHSHVYQCESKRTGEKWAVKIMEKIILKKNEANRYLKEINIMKNLDHPNIIKIHEFF